MTASRGPPPALPSYNSHVLADGAGKGAAAGTRRREARGLRSPPLPRDPRRGGAPGHALRRARPAPPSDPPQRPARPRPRQRRPQPQQPPRAQPQRRGPHRTAAAGPRDRLRGGGRDGEAQEGGREGGRERKRRSPVRLLPPPLLAAERPSHGTRRRLTRSGSRDAAGSGEATGPCRGALPAGGGANGRAGERGGSGRRIGTASPCGRPPASCGQ